MDALATPPAESATSRLLARSGRALSWLGLAVLWGISAGLLVFGARAVAAIGG